MQKYHGNKILGNNIAKDIPMLIWNMFNFENTLKLLGKHEKFVILYVCVVARVWNIGMIGMAEFHGKMRHRAYNII